MKALIISTLITIASLGAVSVQAAGFFFLEEKAANVSSLG